MEQIEKMRPAEAEEYIAELYGDELYGRVLGGRETVARQGCRRCPRGLEGLRAPTLIPWGVRMRPQALWHTHANAQPRIRTYPYIRIRVYA